MTDSKAEYLKAIVTCFQMASGRVLSMYISVGSVPVTSSYYPPAVARDELWKKTLLLELFISLITMMISQVLAYVHTHQIVHIKCMQFYFNYT